jgi:hypothetical protein
MHPLRMSAQVSYAAFLEYFNSVKILQLCLYVSSGISKLHIICSFLGIFYLSQYTVHQLRMSEQVLAKCISYAAFLEYFNSVKMHPLRMSAQVSYAAFLE